MSVIEIPRGVHESRTTFGRSVFHPSSPRRIFDVTIVLIALTLLSPAILVILAAIWLDSGRPFLFSQIRLGQRGKPFRLYKFRKFRPDSPADGCPLTVKNDRRMTRLGRVLEKSKLDELPQLWNVLKGDMSLVGPRPETPNFLDCFHRGFRRVLEFRPGIVGPGQAFSRGESALYPPGEDPETYYRAVLFPVKATIDLAYYPGSTLASDIGWILRCALAVFGYPAACPAKLLAATGAQQSPDGRENPRIPELFKQLAAARWRELQLGARVTLPSRSEAEPAHVAAGETAIAARSASDRVEAGLADEVTTRASSGVHWLTVDARYIEQLECRLKEKDDLVRLLSAQIATREQQMSELLSECRNMRGLVFGARRAPGRSRAEKPNQAARAQRQRAAASETSFA